MNGFIKRRWIMMLLTMLIVLISTNFIMLLKHIDCKAANISSPEKELAKNKTSLYFVAHACGEYDGITYTNSLNALNANYKRGFNIFEIDFNYTSDGHIVLIHDWVGTGKKLYGTSKTVYSYKKFKELKTIDNLILMDIDALISWLKTHNHTFVVTDCKGRNLDMLKEISIKYPSMVQRFLPQMGPFDEYTKLKQFGYRNIILALYKTHYNDNEVLNFVRSNNLFAVSMPEKRAETILALKLKKLNIKVYAHTVNSLVQYKQLINNGVYGIYTDSIAPITAKQKGAHVV